MSNTYSPEAIERMKAASQDFYSNSRLVCQLLSLTLLSGLRGPDRSLRWRHSLALVFLASSYVLVWVEPITAILQHHRVSLPTSLTFGYSVGLGGALPNVCDAPIRDISAWPCIYGDFKLWLANIAGDEGWRYFMRPDPPVVYGVVAIIWLFLAPVLVTKVQRSAGICAPKVKPAKAAQIDVEHLFERKEKDLEAGIIDSELNKGRKQ